MPKTRKTVQIQNLAKYDVLIEDTSPTSTYFRVTDLPPVFTGGRNSFMIAGSSLLTPGSNIKIEILDARGIPIFQTAIKKYVEGNSRLVSVEITEETAPGFATIIILGQAATTENGQPIPPDWKSSYNVRWHTKIQVEPNLRNKAKIILQDTPQIFSQEKRLYSIDTSSYTTSDVLFTASLSPILYSGYQIGYLLKAESPTKFTSDYIGSVVTGSLTVDGVVVPMSLPISNILNDTTAISTGKTLQKGGEIIDKLYLYSGSYTTPIQGTPASIQSSAVIRYGITSLETPHIPISYAQLRIAGMNTISGEIYKLRVYSKVSTNLSDYKLVAEIPTITNNLLVTQSFRGELALGDFAQSPTASQNWYADRLETSSNAIYTISGSDPYYTPSAPATASITLDVSDDVLLRAVKAEVALFNEEDYDGYISESGYFIGTTRPIDVFPSTEYTLELNSTYKRASGSAYLSNDGATVDIYIIGENGTLVIDNDPLGQKIGTIQAVAGKEIQRFDNTQFNFTPKISTVSGSVGLRFVINDGFWYFSDILLKPTSDLLFGPDEVTILVPNTEYYNELLQHKVEFLGLNNNSTDLSIISVPTFFTGSSIDLGVLPT